MSGISRHKFEYEFKRSQLVMLGHCEQPSIGICAHIDEISENSVFVEGIGRTGVEHCLTTDVDALQRERKSAQSGILLIPPLQIDLSVLKPQKRSFGVEEHSLYTEHSGIRAIALQSALKSASTCAGGN